MGPVGGSLWGYTTKLYIEGEQITTYLYRNPTDKDDNVFIFFEKRSFRYDFDDEKSKTKWSFLKQIVFFKVRFLKKVVFKAIFLKNDRFLFLRFFMIFSKPWKLF